MGERDEFRKLWPNSPGTKLYSPPPSARTPPAMESEMTALSRDEIRAKYSNDPNWPIQSFDAADWAKAFMKLFGGARRGEIDEGLMIGWFANALMRGWDGHAQKHPEPAPPAAPADWVLVPREPTPEMIAFAWNTRHVPHGRESKSAVSIAAWLIDAHLDSSLLDAIYRAMLAAAPSTLPPSAPAVTEEEIADLIEANTGVSAIDGRLRVVNAEIAARAIISRLTAKPEGSK